MFLEGEIKIVKWKQFLKPDWRKIVMSVILIILPIFQTIHAMRTTRPGVDDISIRLTPIVGVILFPIFILAIVLRSLIKYIAIHGLVLGYYLTILGLIISLIYLYLLSCLIIWIYDKYKKKRIR